MRRPRRRARRRSPRSTLSACRTSCEHRIREGDAARDGSSASGYFFAVFAARPLAAVAQLAARLAFAPFVALLALRDFVALAARVVPQRVVVLAVLAVVALPADAACAVGAAFAGPDAAVAGASRPATAPKSVV